MVFLSFLSLFPFPHALPHTHSVYDSRVAPGVQTDPDGPVRYTTLHHGTVVYGTLRPLQRSTVTDGLGTSWRFSVLFGFLFLLFFGVPIFFLVTASTIPIWRTRKASP